MSEYILVLNCQRHDSVAFRELVHRWQPRLYYYLRRMVGKKEDVWDILQEVWLTVFKEVSHLQDVRAFPGWLYRIAHSKSVDWLRRENRYVPLEDEPISTEEEFAIPQTAENVPVIHRLLENLSLPHREVMTLFFLEEFSVRQIAQILDTSEGTIKSRLFYAKRKLHELWKGADHG